MKTVYKLSKMSVSDVVNIVTQHSKEKQSLEDKHQIKPYYMVIDEINEAISQKSLGSLLL